MTHQVEAQVQQLLRSPSPEAVQRFFGQVTQSSSGLEVRLDAGEAKGKGVFATKASLTVFVSDFNAGSVLITEPPLVGIQHNSNRTAALVCSHCFQYLGSVETQIGVRLAALQGEAELDGEADGAPGRGEGVGGVADNEELIYALLTGDLNLPLTDQVPLPEVVLCPGGCSDDKYCSERCAQAAWQQYHSLLCLGDACGGNSSSSSAINASPQGKGKAPVVQEAAQHVESREQRQQRLGALHEFNDHADETNDVFLLAAKVVATVLLRAQQVLEAAQQPGSGNINSGSAAGATKSSNSADSSGAGNDSERGSGSGQGGGGALEADRCWEALLAAWEPFAMGYKAVWWQSVALPEDVTNEDDFRQSIRQLAEDSLELLKAAIYNPRFPALFDLRVWGSIIGMFELNNLNLFVPSPIQRWQGLIEDLPDSEREVVLEDIGGLLDALSQFEEDGCEGNAFYTLQSCLNHSCVPNAHAFKRDDDTDGSAVILALRDIRLGEEITISYVDEDASLGQRTADLADYGFTCSCDKCCAERLAGELHLGNQ
ncbi:hypothetical protein N2152v2_010307 [Parachlorella kessleri]